MPSLREIARDWGVTRQTVQAAVKRGCPTDSFEAARFWRQANQKRAWRKPPQSLSASDSDTVPEKIGPRGPIIEDVGDDMVIGSKEAVRQCWILLRKALIEGRTQAIGAWLSLYTRAVEARVKVESMVREEQERQKILVPLHEAQSITGKVVRIIVSRLNALPENLSARCDLTNPQMTMTVLEEECAAILRDAQQAL
jgi:hypothetical protein